MSSWNGDQFRNIHLTLASFKAVFANLCGDMLAKRVMVFKVQTNSVA
jgi:hypothetical protein